MQNLPTTPIRSIASDGVETCALDVAGRVFCWGDRASYADGPRSKHEALHRVPSDSAMARGLIAPPHPTVRVGRFICAVKPGKPLRCTPMFVSKSPESATFGLKPVDVNSLVSTDALAASPHRDGLCSLREGRVDCGEVGHAFTHQTRVHALDGALAIAMTELTVCARLPVRTRCIALDFPGNDGPMTMRTVVDLPVSADEIGVGRELMCLRVGGLVTCYRDLSKAPMLRVETVEVRDAVQLAVGDRHACALRRSGSVDCWGRDDGGQLGQFEPPIRPPTDVEAITDATELVANAMYGCALTPHGTLHCWTTSAKPPKPQLFAGLHDVVAIGQLQAWANVTEGLVLRSSGSARVLAMSNSPSYGERLEPTTIDATAVSNSVVGTTILRKGRYFFVSRASSSATQSKSSNVDAVVLEGPPALREKDYEAVQKTTYGGCAIARASRRVVCFVDREHNNVWRKWDVLPDVNDARALVVNRADRIEAPDGRADICALRATGRVECATYVDGDEPWPTYRPFLDDDLVTLLEGPCGMRRDSTITCAWYDDATRAELLRAAESVTDATLLRLSVTGESGCALRKNGRVACFLVNTEKKIHPGFVDQPPVSVVFP